MDNSTATARQLELVSETFRLPSPAVASVAPHGLNISPDATEADLVALGSRLFAVRSWAKWGLGSVFAAMLTKRPHPDLAGHPGEYDTGWVSDFADAHHLDPKERRELIGVCLFYRGGSPTPGLSFEHHREAMWGAVGVQSEAASQTPPGAPQQTGGTSTTPARRSPLGARSAQPTTGAASASAFLLKAAEEGLSVTQLRAHIRQAGRTEPHEQRELSLAVYSAVFDFHRFAARELAAIADLKPERARMILADLGQESLDFLAALQRVAAITHA